MFYAPDLRRRAEGLVGESEFVHGHGFYVGTNWMLGGEARRQGKKLIYHPHGMFEPWILGRSRWKKRIAGWLFEDANMKGAALWRALTEKEAGQIRGLGFKAPMVVCANGLELGVFEEVPVLREKAEKQKAKRRLLFLGRLHPKKGLDWLVRAWVEVPVALRKDWEVVVAGPDELGHRGQIEKLVDECGVKEDFVFTGTVVGMEKVELLASADAFVLPSRSEGFSVAILEGLACGLPTLVTEGCNFPEVASKGGGWCVETSAEGVKKGLRELLEVVPKEGETRGKLARELVEREYRWEVIARKLADACGSLG